VALVANEDDYRDRRGEYSEGDLDRPERLPPRAARCFTAVRFDRSP
jgi:hypothetical protein